MARFRRKGRFYGNRRNKKRVTGKQLSTTRVLTRKSATSQARQIVALRNSVNRVRRMLPPVNKMTIAGTAVTWNGSSQSTILDETGFIASMVLPSVYTGNGATIEGDDADYRTGNWIKVHSAYWSIQMTYSFNFASNDGSSYYDGKYSGVQARFVLLAARRTDSQLTSLDSVFQIAGLSGTAYDLNMTNPLKEGLVERWFILGQKKVTLSTTNRIVSFRLKVPLAKIRNYISWDINNPSLYPKHQIYLACITSGLKYQGFFTEASNSVRIVYKPWMIFSNP